ncbi:hypothetical protein VP01_1404g1 [Puccinia sorghi]|uniref:Uncharacterized protein n=1 Tax=Puccinia sorghi TaxID=27349 RepID=A0A0L6VMS4_9BASI|nr:hypothetical protein VP01_1404g1 [Puccinia sorghi]
MSPVIRCLLIGPGFVFWVQVSWWKTGQESNRFFLEAMHNKWWGLIIVLCCHLVQTHKDNNQQNMQYDMHHMKQKNMALSFLLSAIHSLGFSSSMDPSCQRSQSLVFWGLSGLELCIHWPPLPKQQRFTLKNRSSGDLSGFGWFCSKTILFSTLNKTITTPHLMYCTWIEKSGEFSERVYRSADILKPSHTVKTKKKILPTADQMIPCSLGVVCIFDWLNIQFYDSGQIMVSKMKNKWTQFSHIEVCCIFFHILSRNKPKSHLVWLHVGLVLCPVGLFNPLVQAANLGTYPSLAWPNPSFFFYDMVIVMPPPLVKSIAYHKVLEGMAHLLGIWTMRVGFLPSVLGYVPSWLEHWPSILGYSDKTSAPVLLTTIAKDEDMESFYVLKLSPSNEYKKELNWRQENKGLYLQFYFCMGSCGNPNFNFSNTIQPKTSLWMILKIEPRAIFDLHCFWKYPSVNHPFLTPTSNPNENNPQSTQNMKPKNSKSKKAPKETDCKDPHLRPIKLSYGSPSFHWQIINKRELLSAIIDFNRLGPFLMVGWDKTVGNSHLPGSLAMHIFRRCGTCYGLSLTISIIYLECASNLLFLTCFHFALIPGKPPFLSLLSFFYLLFLLMFYFCLIFFSPLLTPHGFTDEIYTYFYFTVIPEVCCCHSDFLNLMLDELKKRRRKRRGSWKRGKRREREMRVRLLESLSYFYDSIAGSPMLPTDKCRHVELRVIYHSTSDLEEHFKMHSFFQRNRKKSRKVIPSSWHDDEAVWWGMIKYSKRMLDLDEWKYVPFSPSMGYSLSLSAFHQLIF